MAPVLKTGIPERVSGVRIPPSPPHSLSCRETPPYSRRNKRKTRSFAIFPRHTGLEKTDCSARRVDLSYLFSGAPIGSPISHILCCKAKRSQTEGLAVIKDPRIIMAELPNHGPSGLEGH